MSGYTGKVRPVEGRLYRYGVFHGSSEYLHLVACRPQRHLPVFRHGVKQSLDKPAARLIILRSLRLKVEMVRIVPLAPSPHESCLEHIYDIPIFMEYRFELRHMPKDHIHRSVKRVERLSISVLVREAKDGLAPSVTMGLQALPYHLKGLLAYVSVHKVGKIEQGQGKRPLRHPVGLQSDGRNRRRYISVTELQGILMIEPTLRITEILFCRRPGHVKPPVISRSRVLTLVTARETKPEQYGEHKKI